MQRQDQELLNAYISYLRDRSHSFLGYPVATDFDYSELYSLLKYPLNNIGDPTTTSNYAMNSHFFELEVVKFFADLFKAKKDDMWGYVTNGGSEGNLYALYLARELYPQGMVYHSEATHYSVHKNIHLLNMPSIAIRAQENGEIDYEDLKDAIHANRDRPAIIIANIGTTMTEAKDDVTKITAILKNYAIGSHYIHCDAALAGTYLALLENETNFDFSVGIDSIAISGHKFIGSPIPCGVVIVKKSLKDKVAQSVAYIGTKDVTISGSRNGHSPLFLWYAIKKLGKNGLRQRALDSLDKAKYLEEKLKALGIKATRNKNSITVVFPQVPDKIRLKWQLATNDGLSHVICMPGVTIAIIDEFLWDLQASAQE